MSKPLALAIFFLAASAQADFNALVRIVGSHRGLHRVPIPGISLARLAVWMIHPEGVHDFQLAVFEGEAQFDNRDFEELVRSSSDRAQPMIQVHSNRTGETAVIWMRSAHGDLMEMLLVAHDPKDNTVVMRAVIDGEMLARQISDPRHASSVRAGFSRP